MNRHRARCVIAASALLFAALLTVPATGAAAVPGPTCPTSGGPSMPNTKGQSASSPPVVLIHGWTGNPMKATKTALDKKLGSKITTYTFDYHQWGSYWAGDSIVAACLAKYVGQVSTAFRKAGGDGKVILVAHSMGGLAIRYATSATYAAAPITAAEVGVVISLDTPYLGSPWAGQVGDLAHAWEIYHEAVGDYMPDLSDGDAGKCLVEHNKGQALPTACAGLPPWLPSGITLYEIAGDITVKRTLLHVVHLYDVDLRSDGIVSSASSTGYTTSGPGGKAPTITSKASAVVPQYVNCTVTTDALRVVLRRPSFASVLTGLGIATAEEFTDYRVMTDLQNDQETKLTLLYEAAAFIDAPCSHLGITNDPAAIAKVADDISTYLAAHPSGPACVTAGQAKKIVAAAEMLIVGNVSRIRCDQTWAVLDVDVNGGGEDMNGNPEYDNEVVILEYTGGAWHEADRDQVCATVSHSSKVYMWGCTSS